MSITIVATSGSASANSFVTEAEVIAYMATRLNASAWTTVTGSACTENEKKGLIEATRELTVLDWNGRKATDAQALAWPRDLAIDPDSPNAWYFADTTIPQRVKDATCELAFQFLNAGTTDVAALDNTNNLLGKTIGPLSWEYASPSERAKGLRRYPRVWNLIGPLLAPSGNTVSVVRG